MSTGIYKIQSILFPDRIYIGSAISINDRIIRHRYQLKKGIHNNKKLQRHCLKYGIEDLEFHELEICLPSELVEIEQSYLDNLSPYFNILKRAYSLLGFKHTEETKRRISRINSGMKMTREQNIKNSIAQTGNQNAKGCLRSEAFRSHLSELKKKKVIDASNGMIFNSIGEAADYCGLKYQTLYAKLSGRNFNETNLSFYHGT